MNAQTMVECAPRVYGPVAVRNFDARDEQRWDAFVTRCPYATFFHRIGWREIIEDVFGHRTYYLVAERDGEWSGVMRPPRKRTTHSR